MRIVSIEALRAVGATQALAARWLPHIEAACGLYGIDTPARVAAFLAQIGHESGGLRYATELWGPTPAQQRYAGRQDLGNTQPGDGARFKGHGLIQTTGRYNHARVRDRLRERLGDAVPDFEADPVALASDEWAAVSAADYWDDKGLNALADAGDFEAITRRINGGLNGLADRKARWERVQKVMAEGPQEVPVVDLSTAAPHSIQPTQTEETMGPFVAAVLPSLIDLVPKLGKLFSSGSETAERNVKAAEIVVAAAKEAIGARNEQELLETLRADPNAAAAVRQAIEAVWFKVDEVGGGIQAAREANEKYATPGAAGFWLNPAFWLSMVMLVMPFMLLVDVFFVHSNAYDGNLRVQIVTGVLMVISIVGGYWLGTSFSSQRKTELQSGGGR